MTVAQLLTPQPYSPKSTGEIVGRHPLNFYESPSWFTTELLRHVKLSGVINTLAKIRGWGERADVVELLSLTTTTQKLQATHARHLITLTMLATADKRYDDAAIEPDNPGHVSNERTSHHVGNLALDRHWWQLSDDIEILSYSNTLGDVILAIFPQAFVSCKWGIFTCRRWSCSQQIRETNLWVG